LIAFNLKTIMMLLYYDFDLINFQNIVILHNDYEICIVHKTNNS